MAEFSDHGFSGARTGRIAQRAGTSIRMLDHCFGSKDDLDVAMLEVVLADLRHDELHRYATMVGLACCGRAHASTPSRFFKKERKKPAWQKAHPDLTRQMVVACLAPATP